MEGISKTNINKHQHESNMIYDFARALKFKKAFSMLLDIFFFELENYKIKTAVVLKMSLRF